MESFEKCVVILVCSIRAVGGSKRADRVAQNGIGRERKTDVAHRGVGIFLAGAKRFPADDMLVLDDKERSARRKIGRVVDESFQYRRLRTVLADIVDGIADRAEICRRGSRLIEMRSFVHRRRGKRGALVAGLAEMFDNRRFEAFVKRVLAVETLGVCTKGFVKMRAKLLHVGFELALKLGGLLTDLGAKILEITLVFGPQTQFEFFTIHYGSPPSLKAIDWDVCGRRIGLGLLIRW